MLSNYSAEEDSWESLGLQGDQTSQSWRKSVLNIHWKDWCWSWSSNTLATWCEELTHLKRPWCWERLKAGEGGNRGWDSWMASSTQWKWVGANSRRWCRTGKQSILLSMGSQRVEHHLATEQQYGSSVRLYMEFQKLWYLRALWKNGSPWPGPVSTIRRISLCSWPLFQICQ